MKKTIRIGLIILSITVSLFVLTAILIPLVFEPNNYRDAIAHQVKQKTGRTLTLGNIELSLFPWIGVQLSDMTLSNAPGFLPVKTAILKKLKLHFKLLPLLKGEIHVGEITLDGLTVSLARNKKGETNWQDIQNILNQGTSAISNQNKVKNSLPAEPNVTLKRSDDNFTLPDFTIENIHLNNSQVSWNDAIKKVTYQINQLELNLGLFQSQKFAPLDASFHFTSDQPEASGTIQLSSTIDINPLTQVIRLRETKLREIIQSKTIPGGSLDIKSKAKAINLFIEKQLLEVNELETRAYNTQINSTARITSLFNNPAYQASIEIPAFSPRKLLQSLKLAIPASSDPKVLTHFDFKGEVTGNTQALKLKPLNLKLDSTHMTGEIQVQFKKRPLITFNLNTDQLNLDRYLPANKKSTKKVSAYSAASPKKTSIKQASIPYHLQPNTTAPHPSPYMRVSLTKPDAVTRNKAFRYKKPSHALAALTQFDLNGILLIKKLTVNQLQLQQVRMPVKNRNGVMRLNPLTANLYQGISRSDITINSNKDQPEFKLNQQLSNVQLAPLLKDLLGEAKASGKANISARLSSKGLTAASMTSGLNGTAQFNLVDGEVKGIDIPKMKRQLESTLKQQAVPEPSEEATAFSDANGTAVIRNGIITNNDLRATLSHARIGGKGVVSLPANSIDYTLLVKFTSEASAQSGTPYDQMDKAPLPVHIRGALNDPSIKADYQALLNDLATRELRKHESRIKKQLEDEVNKKITNELEKLFNKK